MHRTHFAVRCWCQIADLPLASFLKFLFYFFLFFLFSLLFSLFNYFFLFFFFFFFIGIAAHVNMCTSLYARVYLYTYTGTAILHGTCVCTCSCIYVRMYMVRVCVHVSMCVCACTISSRVEFLNMYVYMCTCSIRYFSRASTPHFLSRSLNSYSFYSLSLLFFFHHFLFSIIKSRCAREHGILLTRA